MEVGDIVSLKKAPQQEGIIKEIKQRKCSNSATPTETFYKVFWFDSGSATNREYLPSDLVLINQEYDD